MSDERFRGASVRNLPRPNKTYGSGRVCAEPGVRDQAVDLQQMEVLLAARARALLRPARQAQEPLRSRITLVGRARRPFPSETGPLRGPVRVRGMPVRPVGPTRGRWSVASCGGSRVRRSPPMRWGTAPPEWQTHDAERSLRASADAHGRLPVLRARRPRLRRPAAVPVVRLSAGRVHDAAVRGPERSPARGRLTLLDEHRAPPPSHRVEERDVLGRLEIAHRDPLLDERAIR